MPITSHSLKQSNCTIEPYLTVDSTLTKTCYRASLEVSIRFSSVGSISANDALKINSSDGTPSEYPLNYRVPRKRSGWWRRAAQFPLCKWKYCGTSARGSVDLRRWSTSWVAAGWSTGSSARSSKLPSAPFFSLSLSLFPSFTVFISLYSLTSFSSFFSRLLLFSPYSLHVFRSPQLTDEWTQRTGWNRQAASLRACNYPVNASDFQASRRPRAIRPASIEKSPLCWRTASRSTRTNAEPARKYANSTLDFVTSRAFHSYATSTIQADYVFCD